MHLMYVLCTKAEGRGSGPHVALSGSSCSMSFLHTLSSSQKAKGIQPPELAQRDPKNIVFVFSCFPKLILKYNVLGFSCCLLCTNDIHLCNKIRWSPLGGHQAARSMLETDSSKSFQSFQSPPVDSQVFHSFPVLQSVIVSLPVWYLLSIWCLVLSNCLLDLGTGVLPYPGYIVSTWTLPGYP